MFSVFVYASNRISLCIRNAEAARCRLARNVINAANAVFVLVTASQKSSAARMPIPPAPTKTSFLWLSPTPVPSAGIHKPPLALWFVSFAVAALSLLLVCGTLAKLGIRPDVRKSFKILNERMSLAAPWAFITELVTVVVDALKRQGRRISPNLKTMAVVVVLTTFDIWSIYSLQPGAGSATIGLLRLLFSKNAGANCQLKISWSLARKVLLDEDSHDCSVKRASCFAEISSPFPGFECIIQPWDDPLPQSNALRGIKTARGPGVWGSPHWKQVKAFDIPAIDPSRLTCIRHLGSGAYGEVVQAVAGRRKLAVKKIEKGEKGKKTLMCEWDQFSVEVFVHHRMRNHLAVPDLFGAFHDKENFYLVTECGEVCLVDREMESLDEAFSYGRQLVEGVQALHDQGIVHLDIKPDNLLLGADGQLLIIDFGGSRPLPMDIDPKRFPEWCALREAGGGMFPILWAGDEDDGVENPHVLDDYTGTVEYMCPLVAQGRPYSYGADLWGVGVTLYIWLTNRHPHYPELTADLPRDENQLSLVQRDFFIKIFSCKKPDRFENWKELNEHPIWAET